MYQDHDMFNTDEKPVLWTFMYILYTRNCLLINNQIIESVRRLLIVRCCNHNTDLLLRLKSIQFAIFLDLLDLS